VLTHNKSSLINPAISAVMAKAMAKGKTSWLGVVIPTTLTNSLTAG
jgi:hypothetical protein